MSKKTLLKNSDFIERGKLLKVENRRLDRHLDLTKLIFEWTTAILKTMNGKDANNKSMPPKSKNANIKIDDVCEYLDELSKEEYLMEMLKKEKFRNEVEKLSMYPGNISENTYKLKNKLRENLPSSSSEEH